MTDTSALSPSSTTTAKRRSHASDPFFNDALFDSVHDHAGNSSSAPPSNRSSERDSSPASSSSTSTSAVKEFIMTPLVMISFVVSLHYVDKNYRAWRVWQHAPERLSFWNWSWNGAEPYQEPSDTTWKLHEPGTDGADMAGGVASAGDGADDHGDEQGTRQSDGTAFGPEPWVLHKKHRKMVKMEIDDALEIRGRVMVFGLVWVTGVLASSYCMLRMLYGLL